MYRRVVCSGFVGYSDAAVTAATAKAAIDDGDNAGDRLWVEEGAVCVFVFRAMMVQV